MKNRVAIKLLVAAILIILGTVACTLLQTVFVNTALAILGIVLVELGCTLTEYTLKQYIKVESR